MAFPVANHGATAIVLDPDGRPVADAVVMCSAHARDALLSDADGRVVIPEWCRTLTCMRGEYLPGRVAVTDGSVVCRLSAGTRVLLRLGPPGCGEQCLAVLRPIEQDGDRASGRLSPDPESGRPEIRLDPVRPGAYIAALHDLEQQWRCRGPIDLPRAGDAIVDAIWRPPLEMAGVVLNENGDPAVDIPVRARAIADAKGGASTAWRCEGDDDAPDRFSAADGSFRVPVDPAGRTMIEAGSSWDPDGHVVIEIAPPFPASLTLRLRKKDR